MELIQKIVQASKEVKRITHQFHLTEDMNVPDIKEDMIQIVQCENSIRITEIVQMEQYLKVKGEVDYGILYITNNEEKRMASLNGKIPMEELIYIEGKAEDSFYVHCNQLEIQTEMIHSRKIGIQAFIELEVEKVTSQQEEMTLDVESDMPTYTKREKISMLQALDVNREEYRIKEEVKLPGTKENIGELLTTQLGCYKLETRVGQGEIQFSGEMQFFCMYITDQWKEDWHMHTIPFEGSIPCYGVEEGMYHTIRHTLDTVNVDAQMDEDGEMRTLMLEAILKMEIQVYQEQEQEIIVDLYALEKKCELTTRPMYLESLIVQKQSRCKVVETLALPELKDELLQICNSSGRLQIEKVDVVEDGIMIEGIVHVQFLYVRGNDTLPYASWEGMVPFAHLIECGGEWKTMKRANTERIYSVIGNLDQVSITMAGNEEVDVKAIVSFQSLIRQPEIIRVIDKVEVRAFTREEQESQAGIIGYIYKNGDDLWELSKLYHTTKESILKINKITEKEIKQGTRLLIFKENLSIL